MKRLGKRNRRNSVKTIGNISNAQKEGSEIFPFTYCQKQELNIWINIVLLKQSSFIPKDVSTGLNAVRLSVYSPEEIAEIIDFANFLKKEHKTENRCNDY